MFRRKESQIHRAASARDRGAEGVDGPLAMLRDLLICMRILTEEVRRSALARCRSVYGRSKLPRYCCPAGRTYQRDTSKYILYHCDIIRRRSALIRIHPAKRFYALSLFTR